MVCTIHRIWEQRLHTQPLWWIEQLKIVFKKTSKREKIQENDKYQKCSFGQSHNPQNQQRKSQQDPVKKKKNTVGGHKMRIFTANIPTFHSRYKR
jgi:hypothetical protein